MASPLWSTHKDLFWLLDASFWKWSRESGAGKKLKDETQILALGKWLRTNFRKEGTPLLAPQSRAVRPYQR